MKPMANPYEMLLHLYQTIIRILGKDKRIQAVAVGTGGAVLALAVWAMGWTQTWEARTWDWRVQLLAKKSEFTDQICLILVDQNSLDWGSRENGWAWPWPREVYGVISDYCKRQGAGMLAVDVLFTEPSPFGEADDERLGKAMSDYGKVISAMFLGEKTGSEQNWPESVPPPDLHVEELEQWTKKHTDAGMVFSRAAFPIPEISRHSRMLCNVHLNPDPDGVYRRGRLFSVFDGKHIPSLGIAGFLADSTVKEAHIKKSMLSIGEYDIPLDQKGNAILRYRGPSGTHKSYSAAAVLQSELRLISGEKPVIADENAFKGKYVFLGFSAPGLYDLRSSPVGGVYPGVEIYHHARQSSCQGFYSGDTCMGRSSSDSCGFHWLRAGSILFHQTSDSCGYLFVFYLYPPNDSLYFLCQGHLVSLCSL